VSRDLFKFWEITDNISETAQDTDGRLIENRIHGLSNGTITNDRE